MRLLVVSLAGAGTAVATGLGVLPLVALGKRAALLRPFLAGITVGLMTVASLVGLLRPALDEGGRYSVGVGLLAGGAFLLAGRRFLARRDAGFAGRSGAGVRRSILVFSVLLVHSLPEGFAIGAAYAAERAGLGLFVILAIVLQNIPEGTSVAIPMEAAGFTQSQQVWAAVLTSSPQPVGAAVAFLLVEEIRSLLPVSLAFAAGAMLALVFLELALEAFHPGARASAAAGTAFGTALALGLAAVFGV